MSNLKVNYDNISKDFSKSRVGMKWPEITYLYENFLKNYSEINLLDIGCGSARLLEQLSTIGNLDINYTGVDNSNGMLENAKINFPESDLILSDMTKVNSDKKFNIITFIASFHHLNNIEDRELCLKNIYNNLEDDGIIFLTNWALDSELNKYKYNESIIENSKNHFGSLDYLIKFGEYERYYHGFNLRELEYLANNAGFKIIENRLFDNQKNFITILKK